MVLGIAAEQVFRRWQWLVAYVGAAAVGQIAGYAWQPVGAGNSIAVCGLAGLIIVWAWRGRPGLPPFAVPAALLWFGALLATWNFWLILVGIALVMIAPRLDWTQTRWRWAALAVSIAVGAFLCAVRNIHGAALLTGLILGVLLTAGSGDRSRQKRRHRLDAAAPDGVPASQRRLTASRHGGGA